MEAHCTETGHGKSALDMSEALFLAAQPDKPLAGVMITLAYLCWNTAVASRDGIIALIAEANRLVGFGAEVRLHVFDNGSTDGTYHYARRLLVAVPPEIKTYLTGFSVNEGISKARNQLYRSAVRGGSQFIQFMDGDIEQVPYSTYLMVRYLLCHSKVGCIGAYPASFTARRSEASPILTEINQSWVHSDIHCAYTQYGLFRVAMFDEDGLAFDENEAMGRPGWGFEDTDYYLAMRENGWESHYFSGMTYLHRALHSSWSHLPDLALTFEARKAYLLSKWRARGMDPGILNILEGQQLPVWQTP